MSFPLQYLYCSFKNKEGKICNKRSSPILFKDDKYIFKCCNHLNYREKKRK